MLRDLHPKLSPACVDIKISSNEDYNPTNEKIIAPRVVLRPSNVTPDASFDTQNGLDTEKLIRKLKKI